MDSHHKPISQPCEELLSTHMQSFNNKNHDQMNFSYAKLDECLTTNYNVKSGNLTINHGNVIFNY